MNIGSVGVCLGVLGNVETIISINNVSVGILMVIT